MLFTGLFLLSISSLGQAQSDNGYFNDHHEDCSDTCNIYCSSLPIIVT